MSNALKFYRVPSLPDQGEIGGLYFVAGEENYGLWVYTGEFEPYTPQNYLETADVTPELASSVSVEDDTLVVDSDTAVVRNNIMKVSTAFAEVEGDKLILNV